MSIWPPGTKPSERIQAVLAGRVDLTKEDPAIQSACKKPIFDGAKEILAMPRISDRRRTLDKIPPLIRPHVEAEILRLHRLSK